MDLTPDKATICIVNYKTEELTRLCLRSIRKYTSYPHDVIVVDNDSQDASLDYLRSLKWITLIERPNEVHKSGSWAHGTGLDLGLDACRTEFFVAMHSDTFVHQEGWLDCLVNYAKKEPFPACVGCGKLDLKPKWQVVLKKYTDVKDWLRRMKKDAKRSDFYIRTICGLYKTEVLLKEGLRFAMNVEDGVTCGKQLYYELVDRGYPTHPLQAYDMADCIYHLAHATMVLNPEFTVRKRTEKKCRKQIEKVFNSPVVQEVIHDSSLDE